MARLGMDVDAVERIGRQLKNHASSISTIIATIDSDIKSLTTVWDGKDAQNFVNNWWPAHKKALTKAKDDVQGLGQSALNNAAEQREVSAR
ncbi:MAG: WXG100 family type VII secretion target [Bifidobacteriaceae bacterium]|jgi:uncharacterized protein YukE|nr:WXG100 family type VII secretion target [Bifidobacteriaceae bacterium]